MKVPVTHYFKAPGLSALLLICDLHQKLNIRGMKLFNIKNEESNYVFIVFLTGFELVVSWCSELVL